MTTVWVLIGIAVLALAALVPTALAGVFIRPAPPCSPDRAISRAEALARLATLQALDGDSTHDACRTQLFEAPGGSDVTVVVWHGLTNCPAQFRDVTPALLATGVNVLLPRMPRHGRTDLLTRELADLTPDELVAHVDASIDIAAGLSTQVWVLGFSCGGVLASYAASQRPEVRRAAIIAPLIAPKGVPLPLVRLLVAFGGFAPRRYVWWDPRKKAALDAGPYVYPGFPLAAVVPYLYIAQTLLDGKRLTRKRLERTVLVTNPGDFVVRRDAARAFMSRVFGEHSDVFTEIALSPSLDWWHDFIDPLSPHAGSADQVSEVLIDALGIASDPSGLIRPESPPRSR